MNGNGFVGCKSMGICVVYDVRVLIVTSVIGSFDTKSTLHVTVSGKTLLSVEIPFQSNQEDL